QQAVTLSYNGNGATGGSTAAQTGYRYYNSNGQTLNASFSLRANGFTRTSYTFSKWALGSAGGTQYAAGAGVTLAASTIFYALWVGNPHTFAPNKASWAITEERGEDNGLYVYETSVVIEGRKSDGAVAYGVTAAAATIPTGGCSKLRLTTSSDFDPECTATVDGVLKYGPGELEFDVAGKSSVKVSIRLSTGSDYRKSQVTLSQIYFYN
ncbi:MAG: InlB B-repeat-containing protein, partial [Lachnospiraceae bacterium]|nr:InlB B-repeat-containing protein [Lachnospiraceae bacterium]